MKILYRTDPTFLDPPPLSGNGNKIFISRKRRTGIWIQALQSCLRIIKKKGPSPFLQGTCQELNYIPFLQDACQI